MFEGEFQLEDKRCDLSVYLNTPTQKHGDDRLPAKVIGITGVPMDKAEVNEFFGDPHAWDMLFLEAKGKAAVDFWADKLGAMPLAIGKFKGSEVTIKFGLKPHEVTFGDCTIKTCKIARATGGVVLLSFTVVALKSNVSGDLSKLDEFLGTSANVCISFGDPADEDEDDEDKDPELDLDHQSAAGGPSNGNVKTEKVDTSKRRSRKPSTDATLN